MAALSPATVRARLSDDHVCLVMYPPSTSYEDEPETFTVTDDTLIGVTASEKRNMVTLALWSYSVRFKRARASESWDELGEAEVQASLLQASAGQRLLLCCVQHRLGAGWKAPQRRQTRVRRIRRVRGGYGRGG